ncbi:hypothetical protein D3C84_1217970 [compost metagenome]
MEHQLCVIVDDHFVTAEEQQSTHRVSDTIQNGDDTTFRRTNCRNQLNASVQTTTRSVQVNVNCVIWSGSADDVDHFAV